MLRVLVVSIAVFSIPALGCFSPLPEQLTAPEELIARTENIVLAEVVEAKSALDSYEVLYTFESVRTLKGEEAGQFQITGHPGIWEGDNRRFGDHSDRQFWKNGGGRSMADTDCQIYPTFTVGGIYLVFLNRPYHVKSFEIIIRTHGGADTRDKWLQYVEKHVVP